MRRIVDHKLTARIVLSSVSTVAFDFDETLVDEAHSRRLRWHKTLKNFTCLSDKLEETFFSIFDEKNHKHKTNLTEAFAKIGVGEEHIPLVIKAFRASHSGEERVYKSVREVLILLKQLGKRIGVITDGVRDYQEPRLRVAGLYELLDFFHYGDMHQKPDREFFKKCFEEEGIKPHELLYVGDHIEKDVAGALAAGAKAIWIRQGNMMQAPEGALNFDTMDEFLQWLKKV